MKYLGMSFFYCTFLVLAHALWAIPVGWYDDIVWWRYDDVR